MSLVIPLKPLKPVSPPTDDYVTTKWKVAVGVAATRMLCDESPAYSKLERVSPFDRVNRRSLLVEHLMITAEEEYRAGFGPTVWLAPEPKLSKECLVWSPAAVNHTLSSMVRWNDKPKQALRGVTPVCCSFAFRPRGDKIRYYSSALECHQAFMRDRMGVLEFYINQPHTPERLREMLKAKVQYWNEQLARDGAVSKF